jgi:anion-transporting  ArsA/GET3 family ATPase
VGPGVGAIGLLDHRLVFVTGKGGVGKSTVAAALGALAASQGRRVVVAEVHRRADVEHVVTAAGADHLSIDPQDAMEEYLGDQLPRPLADLLSSSRAFGYLAAATPGMRELLTAGKVWELAQDERRTPGAQPYDLVVVDAPATGHAVALLEAPATFAAAARVGPIARQGAAIDAMLRDPAQTAVVAVTTAEEMPVNETLALGDDLRARLGLEPSLIVVNGLRPDRLSAAEAQRLRQAAGEHPAVRTALALHAHAREQRAQLARLRRHVTVPTITLPHQLAAVDVPALARRLTRAAA